MKNEFWIKYWLYYSADYAGKDITKQDYITFNKEALIADWAYSVSGGDPQKEQAHLLAMHKILI